MKQAIEVGNCRGHQFLWILHVFGLLQGELGLGSAWKSEQRLGGPTHAAAIGVEGLLIEDGQHGLDPALEPVLASIKDPILLAWLDANPAARGAAERQEAMASKFAHLDEVLKQAAQDEKRRKEERMAGIEARRFARLDALKVRRAAAQAAEKVRLAALQVRRKQAKTQRQVKTKLITNGKPGMPSRNDTDHPTTNEGRTAAAAKSRARIEAMEQTAAAAATARPLVLRRPAGWGQG